MFYQPDNCRKGKEVKMKRWILMQLIFEILYLNLPMQRMHLYMYYCLDLDGSSNL